PAVAEKFLDAALAVESFGQHFATARAALGESGASLFWGAVRPVELGWNFQMRSGQPDPLAADVVHVREDGGDRADFCEWISCRLWPPRGRIKVFDHKLVHALI